MPQSWNNRELLQITENFIEQHKESLSELKECF
jgi:hypothetical protein